ncbi:superoxide dismutase family protein [Sphingosinicella sp. CPCC 101087]|uniref:superoxide dismutase family protein n=1 Tax=Sphingosinicella sp. CPCC 101087 TaxID=2497754 RepID=UPI00101DAFF0|nr:superoxide dismutase family protein [Sphingosinicella sp. CPCC 101087]
MNRSGWMALALAVGLSGCGAPDTTQEAGNEAVGSPDNGMASNDIGDSGTARQAVATLQTAEGAAAGTATATAGEGGIMLSLSVEGLPPGQHGAHVHMTGQCDAPGFESAGGHWNPAERQHGLENPQGQHAGDMPNLVVGEDGRGSMEYQLVGGTLEGLSDDDGSAMVIHASADDQRTDPSGNSGDRIACGVFAAG